MSKEQIEDVSDTETLGTRFDALVETTVTHPKEIIPIDDDAHSDHSESLDHNLETTPDQQTTDTLAKEFEVSQKTIKDLESKLQTANKKNLHLENEKLSGSFFLSQTLFAFLPAHS